MVTENYSVGIIGLGNIGFGYDVGAGSELVRTHSRAVHLHGQTKLAWGADLSADVRDSFEKEYGAKSYESAAKALVAEPVDIVVVATGISQRDDLLSVVMSSRPKLVIIEKPLARTADEAVELNEQCRLSDIELLVNYPRRYSTSASRARNLVSNGDLGDFQAGNVWYGKGLANNGSHLLNLVFHVLGLGWEVTQAALDRPAGNDEDADVSFELTRGGNRVSFQSIDTKNYSLAEVDLLFENGRLRFVDHGYQLVESVGVQPASFEGYFELNDDSHAAETAIDDYQLKVIEFAVESLEAGSDFSNDIEDALSVAQTVDSVLSFAGWSPQDA